MIYISCSVILLILRVDPPLKLYFTSNSEILDSTSILTMENSDLEDVIISFNDLINYIKLYYPSLSLQEVRILTPRAIIFPERVNEGVRLNITQNLTIQESLFFSNIFHYHSILKKTHDKPKLNSNIFNSLLSLFSTKLKVQLSDFEANKIIHQVSPGLLNRLLILVSYQTNILQLKEQQISKEQLHEYFFDEMNISNDPVVKLCLLMYIYSNSNLIKDGTMIGLFYDIRLSFEDIVFLDAMGSIYSQLVNEFPKDQILLISLDLILYTIAFTAFLNNKLPKHTVHTLFESSAILAEVSSVDRQITVNIYHNYSAILATTFDVYQKRYYEQVSFSTAVDLIEKEMISGNNNSILSIILNFLKQNNEVTIHEREIIRKFIDNLLTSNELEYSTLYLISCISPLLEISHDFSNSYKHQLASNMSCIFPILDIGSSMEFDLSEKIDQVNAVRDLVNKMKTSITMERDTLLQIHIESIQYIEPIFRLIKNEYNMSEVLPVIGNLIADINNNTNFVTHFLSPYIEIHTLGFVISNLSNLTYSNVLKLIETLEIPQQTDLVTPKSLLVNLIKFYFNAYSLSSAEVKYLRQANVLLDSSSSEQRSALELIDDFYMFIKTRNSVQEPVLELKRDKAGHMIYREDHYTITL